MIDHRYSYCYVPCFCNYLQLSPIYEVDEEAAAAGGPSRAGFGGMRKPSALPSDIATTSVTDGRSFAGSGVEGKLNPETGDGDNV
ncbi:hypothetical protein SDJN03_20280, partial [Cucurbita argyrosperma subsp. sororia]